MKRKRPRNRRALVLWAIACHINRYGYPPSIAEIGRRVGLYSTSSVQHHMTCLAAMGRLERDSHRPGCLRLLLTPGVVTVPVSRCEPCGRSMPADHVCRAVVEDLQRYGTPGDLPDGGA